MNCQFSTFDENREQAQAAIEFTESTRNGAISGKFGWPLFEFHSQSAEYWSKLSKYFPKYQFFLSENNDIIASCFAVPFYWQGDSASLPEGWDKVLEKGFLDFDSDQTPNSMSLLAITVKPEYQSKGISKLILNEVKNYANKMQLQHLVAPVRPMLKQFYPLFSIDEYVEWKTKDDKVFDPWLRVHLSMGAKTIKLAPQSLIIEGSIADWENWSSMRFPVSGKYIVQGALSPVSVNVDEDRVVYHQPNIWVEHIL